MPSDTEELRAAHEGDKGAQFFTPPTALLTDPAEALGPLVQTDVRLGLLMCPDGCMRST